MGLAQIQMKPSTTKSDVITPRVRNLLISVLDDVRVPADNKIYVVLSAPR